MERLHEIKNQYIFDDFPALKKSIDDIIDKELGQEGTVAKIGTEDTLEQIALIIKGSRLTDSKKSFIEQAIMDYFKHMNSIRPDLPKRAKELMITKTLELTKNTIKEIAKHSYDLRASVKKYYGSD